MSDIVKILYNNVDAFAPQPTPLVELNEETIYLGGTWAVAENVVLNGQITGCTFGALISGQANLLNKFNKSFQNLEIWQETNGVSGRVFLKEFVEIQAIDFPSNNYVGVLPYAISLLCYPSGLFSGFFGILDPEDSWELTEQQDSVLSATHTVSCRPFNTSASASNALSNAKNWVFGRTGTASAISPILISGANISKFILTTQSENIDRFNGTYSIVENYVNDLARTGFGVIRYNTDISSGNNIISVNLNGNVYGPDITAARRAFANIDKTAIAVKQYQSVFGRTDLNPIALSQTFSEDPFEETIDFSYSYDNSNLPSVWFDYTVNLTVGTNGLITASIQGTVFARGGDVASKLVRTKLYASTVNLYNLVLPFYGPFDVSSVTSLNSVARTKSQSNNETDGTVDLSAVFDNKNNQSSAFESFDYTITVTPSITQMDAQPILGGHGSYSVVNLRFASRATVSMGGTAKLAEGTAVSAGAALVRAQAYSIFAQYGLFIYATIDNSETTVSDDKTVNFSYNWSCGPGSPASIGSIHI